MKYSLKNLGEIAEVTKLAGFEFTKYIRYNKNGEIIALRALNIKKVNLIYLILNIFQKKFLKNYLEVNSIKMTYYITYTGNSYGNCVIIDENDKYHLAPNVCKVVLNQKVVDPYFLYCCINSTKFYKQMKNNISCSAQSTISMRNIRMLKVPVPDMNIQKSISNKIN